MNKTKTYFAILIIAVAIIAIAYVFNIGQIKSFVSMCLNYAGNNILTTTAAICTFIFIGNKNYWLILLGCALIISLIVQVVISGHGAGVINTLAQMTTFMSIAFLMNLIKLIINK